MTARNPAWPLLVTKLLDYAAHIHGERPIVSQTMEGGLHRTSWGELAVRTRRLARAL